METLTIRFTGERALFRNIAIPGADVADSALVGRERAAYGLLGNMLGLWRDFDDSENLELAGDLNEWIELHSASIEAIDYEFGETRVIGQHRYKTTNQFTKSGESGPKPITYHWDAELIITLKIDESGAAEIDKAIRQPIGSPYMGQSNCLAQVHLIG